MEIIGFILGICIGASLGLIGSGGSVLTIPVLVYLMAISPSVATSYSLFVVGVSSLVGSYQGLKNKLVDLRMALYFGLPSLVSIWLMRQFLVPRLPETFLNIGQFELSKNLSIMLVFAVLMLFSSWSMIKKPAGFGPTKPISTSSIVAKGLFVGVLSGFVGVGGGFLIIPTLLFSAQMPMKKAVATSLVIVACNALVGFAGSLYQTSIHWPFLLGFTAFSVLGMLAGMWLSGKISDDKLKPAFGWFVLATGIYIIIKEIYIH
jgi:uncharacterized protein